MILDPDTVAELRSLDEPGEDEIFRDVMSTFLEDAGIRLEAIAAAVASGDHEKQRREAHTLKGSCRTVGATQMAELSAELEIGLGHVTAAKLQALRDALAASSAEIRELLATDGAVSPERGD